MQIALYLRKENQVTTYLLFIYEIVSFRLLAKDDKNHVFKYTYKIHQTHIRIHYDKELNNKIV